MVKNRDIVIFGLQRWDKFTSTITRNTAIEMAKNNRVLFVNQPLKRKRAIFNKDLPFVQKRLKILHCEEDDLVQEYNNLWVFYPKMIAESINWINSETIFSILHKNNEKKYANRIKNAIERLGFKNIILFGDTEMITGYYLKEYLKPDIFFYLLRDAVTSVSYHKKHGTKLQPLLMKKADFVVTNSNTFEEFARKHNPKSYFIGQGCDVDLYSDIDGKLIVPDDIKSIKKPIIGYIGALTTIRLDINELYYIAEQRPDWSLVLIGPQQEGFEKSKLDELDNVYFLGAKKPDTLPSYLKGMDVTLNPQIVNEITDLNYPLKIDEYLAMGKPVVATSTSFMEYYFKGCTYLANTKEEYVALIEKALMEDSPELQQKRIKIAGEHSWENFVNKIYHYIEEFEK
ncbi:MAG: glycosyltransferase [Bacteroidetes bacterium]|nr:glycosyltransferase [Bacteroidota bacterium]